jgi:hypothetical protein
MGRVSVSDGRRTIGSVVERDDGFHALDLEGRVIGIFHSAPAAASRLWLHDRRLPSIEKENVPTGERQRRVEDLLRDELADLEHAVASERGSNDA